MEIKLKCRISSLMSNHRFYGMFEPELLSYVRKTTLENNERNICKAIKCLYFSKIFTFKQFKEKVCTKELLKYWNGTHFVYSEIDRKYLKGNSFRGKKRPEHSKLMSKKMKVSANNRSDEHKANNAKFLKTTWFYKRCLNLNLITKEEEKTLSLEQVKTIFGKWAKQNCLSLQYKANKIKHFLNSSKYSQYEMFNTFKNKYKDTLIIEDNFEKIYSEMLSIISLVVISSPDNNMGVTKFFKTGTLFVKQCQNKTIIKYRSSWERDTILFFEKEEIKYEYEPFYIEMLNGCNYLPDFLLEPNAEFNKPVLLEIKGFIRGKQGKEKEEIKKQAAINYAKANNLIFAYVTKTVNNLEQIKKQILWE